jgi:flagellar P-ring protein precursor FlgI
MLSAELPPFAGQGQRLDVQVSAVGDARSLRGGRLLVAPLYAGKPENVIARAQGSLWFSGQAEPAVPTSATLPDGAVVERAVPTRFLDDSGAIRLLPRRGDITAAQAVAEAVNQGLDRSAAVAVNGGLVVVRMTQAEAADPVAFLSTVLQLPVDLTIPATVVIDSQTGTVTMTAQAMVRPCAFAHGDVVIRIGEPSGEGAAALPAEGVRLRDLVDQLNRAGVAPRDLAAILQGLARAGALQAELVVE